MPLLHVLATIVLVAVIVWLLGLIPGVEGRFKQLINAVAVIVLVVVVLTWLLGLFGVVTPAPLKLY